jgi:DNA invertase Pin-like site-specific DNA recombinase
MKKAALYARVSSDIQKQERTIESQLFELRKQIAAAGHVLKYGLTYSYEKRVPRDRSEWIGIKIPAIISKELFDRV